jgi:hypothetical protein
MGFAAGADFDVQALAAGMKIGLFINRKSAKACCIAFSSLTKVNVTAPQIPNSRAGSLWRIANRSSIRDLGSV